MDINRDACTCIEYEKNFIAFLDVLGFKNMISSSDLTKVNKYFGIVNSAIGYLKDIPSKKDIGSIVISDSIILTVPCSGDKVEALRHLCVAIGLIQQNLAIEGIWLRGAITYGDAYFNAEDSQIVGPAYINAYLLEEQMAKYPRVILDNKLVHELGFKNSMQLIDSVNKANEGWLDYRNWGERVLFEWVGSINRVPKDLPLFIDYLSPLLEKEDWSSMTKIVENVQENMYSDSRIYGKFKWLADYIVALVDRERELGHQLDISFQMKLIDFQ